MVDSVSAWMRKYATLRITVSQIVYATVESLHLEKVRIYLLFLISFIISVSWVHSTRRCNRVDARFQCYCRIMCYLWTSRFPLDFVCVGWMTGLALRREAGRWKSYQASGRGTALAIGHQTGLCSYNLGPTCPATFGHECIRLHFPLVTNCSMYLLSLWRRKLKKEKENRGNSTVEWTEIAVFVIWNHNATINSKLGGLTACRRGSTLVVVKESRKRPGAQACRD